MKSCSLLFCLRDDKRGLRRTSWDSEKIKDVEGYGKIKYKQTPPSWFLSQMTGLVENQCSDENVHWTDGNKLTYWHSLKPRARIFLRLKTASFSYWQIWRKFCFDLNWNANICILFITQINAIFLTPKYAIGEAWRWVSHTSMPTHCFHSSTFTRNASAVFCFCFALWVAHRSVHQRLIKP